MKSAVSVISSLKLFVNFVISVKIVDDDQNITIHCPHLEASRNDSVLPKLSTQFYDH